MASGRLGLITHASQVGPLVQSVPDTGDVYMVPAFTGLGAPYWDPHARGAVVGITGGTTRAHLARAVVEAMAYQTRDVLEAMKADSAIELKASRRGSRGNGFSLPVSIRPAGNPGSAA